MKILIAWLCAFPVYAVDLKELPLGSPPRKCDVSINFGSHAMGIDGETFAKVTNYAKSSTLPQEGEIRPWGKEGEKEVCLFFKNAQSADRAFIEVKALIPTKGKEGWTTLSRKGRDPVGSK